MENGIIIDRKQYELQDECELLMNLCEVLHNGKAQHAYRYVGKEDEK